MITKSFDFSNDVFELFLLFKEEPHLFFLDSSLTTSANGRYSFIGFDPFEIVEGSDIESFKKFKARFLHLQQACGPSVVPLQSGAVGYLSYDLGMLFQNVPSRKNGLCSTPLFHFGLYDVILTVDHLDQKLHVTSSGFPQTAPGPRRARAEERLNIVVEKLAGLAAVIPSLKRNRDYALPDPIFTSDNTRWQYVAAVERALKHIHEGDIYQINLSHKVVTEQTYSPSDIKAWEMYEFLRELSPSHFSAFLDAGGHQILSTSPERFLCLKDGVAQIRPMKGTRPRGRSLEEDSSLRQELMHSTKEIAELLMVTDLERNDLGKVCDFGSVKVKEMRTIEEYKTVFQATSTIEGRLRKDKTCFDLIEACFPGGSVTGCPKISAMRIIDELEPGSRGIYTGAFGYIDFSGNLDFNILIRTLLLNEGKVSFHVGGGIVADSIPSMEYDETWVKAKALMECLRACQARRGL
ncbi:MAG: anthranilate synthase component I family protein [Candidatus Omnitrophica bacterium]|nr:anthranilate synthase component I family protein [Candidatus Omnitrophota bacterium]